MTTQVTGGLTLRSRNRITLPPELMQALQLKPGMRVEFELRDDGALVMRAVGRGQEAAKEVLFYRTQTSEPN
jgi:antitoxin component of MazEF toxin-antitoxin module